MAWQKRNQLEYYYRSRREGSRITHDYFRRRPCGGGGSEPGRH